MSTIPLLSSLAASLAIAAAPALATEHKESRRILSVIEAMTSAFAAGDVEAVLETYENGAVVVGEPGSPSSGETALRALFEGFLAVEPKFTYHGHEVVEAGDIALHLMPWAMTGKAPDGTPIKDSGLSIAVLRRQVNGGWLMVIDHPYGDMQMKR